jgi:hypothetical protein
MDDSSLLIEFIRTHSEDAFRRIVNRHLNLVYAAARRQVRDPGLADDVTQGFFILLAKQAGTIRNPAALSGWFLSTTCPGAFHQGQSGLLLCLRRTDLAMEQPSTQAHDRRCGADGSESIEIHILRGSHQ